MNENINIICWGIRMGRWVRGSERRKINVGRKGERKGIRNEGREGGGEGRREVGKDKGREEG